MLCFLLKISILAVFFNSGVIHDETPKNGSRSEQTTFPQNSGPGSSP